MSSNTLSDRIVNSANDLKERFLAHPFFKEMILKGEVANPRAVMTYDYKYFKETCGDWEKLFEAGINKAQTPEEKQFLEQLSGMIAVYLQRFETLFKAKFIDYDQTVLSKPSAKEVIPCYVEKLKGDLNAPLIELLVSFLGLFYSWRIASDLKLDPQFKPNWFYNFYVLDYNQLVGVFVALKTLVDNLGIDISVEEEQRLVQLFRIDVENQLRLADLLWKGNYV